MSPASRVTSKEGITPSSPLHYIQINTWAFPYWPGYHPETPILAWDEVECQYGSRDDSPIRTTPVSPIITRSESSRPFENRKQMSREMPVLCWRSLWRDADQTESMHILKIILDTTMSRMEVEAISIKI